MKICPVCRASFGDDMTFCANDGEVLQNDTTSLVGQKIDNQYYIEALLGKGGMGSVYKARHVLLGDLVALKVLSPEMRDNEEWLKRFQREGQAARMFRHPNAVTVHDLRTTPDGLMYLVMEYIEGRTLSDELAARGRYVPADAYALLEPIMSVLHAAHMTGVVHRDLKPDNIMIGQTPNGMPFIKLLDLGVAKVLPRANADANADDSEHISQAKLTTAGQLLGTPFYMSPEQWGETPRDGNEEIDARSDLYSLGAVVYEMVAGHKPFYGGSLYELCDSHLHRTPTPLAELRPDVAPAFSQAVARALNKDRNDRQPNVQVFADDLHDALTQSPIATNYGYDAPSPAATDYGYDGSPASPQTVFDPAGGRATYVDQGGAGMPYDHSPQTNVGGFGGAQTIVEGGIGPVGGNYATNLDYGSRPTVTPQEPVIKSPLPVTVGRVEPPYVPPVIAPPVVPVVQPTESAIVGKPPITDTAPVSGGSGFPKALLAIPVLLLVLAVGGGAWFMLGSKSTTGGGNNGKNNPPAAAETMRYWLEVTTPVPKGQPEAAPKRVAKGPFLSGQDFKFHFAASANGYLYIVGPGENNAPTTFLTAQPIPDTGVTSNRINAGTTFTFPGAGQWFTLDKKAGTEVFTVIFSSTPLTSPAFLADKAGEVLNLAEWDDIRTKYMANKATLNVSSENGAPFVGIQAPQKDTPVLVDIRLEHQ